VRPQHTLLRFSRTESTKKRERHKHFNPRIPIPRLRRPPLLPVGDKDHMSEAASEYDRGETIPAFRGSASESPTPFMIDMVSVLLALDDLSHGHAMPSTTLCHRRMSTQKRDRTSFNCVPIAMKSLADGSSSNVS
jgi:hypothetical protein